MPSRLVAVVADHGLVAGAEDFGQLEVVSWVRVCFLLKHLGQVNLLVNVARHIGELLGQVLRVTLVNNLVIVAPLNQLAEVEDLVDVVGLGLGELG